jgi:hypothetical protein
MRSSDGSTACSNLVFHGLDLAAHRALGQGEFFCGGPKVQVPGDGLKGAQMAHRNRPGAHVVVRRVHGVADSVMH